MSEEDASKASWPCKRDGCDQVVLYVPTVVPGALRRTATKQSRERTVYLRCPRGHVHAYLVSG